MIVQRRIENGGRLAHRQADAKMGMRTTGGVVERLMAPVLKTGRAKVLVGSNPTPSALALGKLLP
jgi:hypothetical protein